MSDDTTTTAADPLDVLTPEQRELVMSAETDEHGPGARLGRIVRDLCERLASAERANENMREDLAIIRQIVGHSINLSSPLVCTVSAIVAAKADAEARLATVREAWPLVHEVLDHVARSDVQGESLGVQTLIVLARRALPPMYGALAAADAGGGEREAR